MKNKIFLILIIVIIVFFSACQTLSLPDGGGNGETGGGGDDPTPQPTTTSTDDILFIHHSCGENWLNNSLNTALLVKDYIDEVNESYYGTCFGPDSGRPDSLWGTPGDSTDMHHWILWFNDYLEGAKELGTSDGENRIIMFKSCYPNNDVTGMGSAPGDPFSDTKTVENYKAIFTRPAGVSSYTHESFDYKPLEEIFAENPDTLFIFVTAPPRAAADGDPNEGQRARDFYDWLRETWLPSYNADHPGLSNVAIFDWFDFLANPEGAATNPNLLKDAYTSDPSDSHPNGTANADSTVHFVSGVSNLLDTIWQAFTD